MFDRFGLVTLDFDLLFCYFYQKSCLGGWVAPEKPLLLWTRGRNLHIPANMDQLCERPFYSGWRINRRFFFIFAGPPTGDCHGSLFPVGPPAESPKALRDLGV